MHAYMYEAVKSTMSAAPTMSVPNSAAAKESCLER